ncbi:MAG: SDR family oxidoreductase [Thermodesulfobacteriota bacterium]
MQQQQVLVTGANGFVGRTLCSALEQKDLSVRRVVRSLFSDVNRPIRAEYTYALGDIGPETKWDAVLKGVDVVIHLAARVHVMQDYASDPLAAFRIVNTAGTEHLAWKSAEAGVRRFIYLSSIKVNGEETGTKENPKFFSETDPPNPLDPYAVSKWEAEQLLRDVAAETGMEVVSIRPPLVYGPGVKANFLRLLQLVDRGIPLPLANVNNMRSLVALGNLVDFILCCIGHPSAAGEVFLISDGEDLSASQLIRKISFFMNRPARLFPVSLKFLRLAGQILGKEDALSRLCGSLQADISKAKRVLDWEPPLSCDEGLMATVAGFMQEKKEIHD